MPIYEFRCDACEERFERLVDVGTESAVCPACATAGARRVLSSPSPSPHLAMSPGQRRRLEDKRGIDRGGAKQRFKEGLRRARERGQARGGGRS